MINLTTSDLQASQWQKAWHDIVIRRLETGLLWQAILFTEEYLPNMSNNYLNTIIFRVNHCIIDGVSGMQLCKQFLSNLLSALKSWLQLILAKYDINGNYSQYIKATSTKLATIIVRPSVNKLQYFVAMETVT